MLKWFLFETRAGNALLAWLERACGVAVVEADALLEMVVRIE